MIKSMILSDIVDITLKLTLLKNIFSGNQFFKFNHEFFAIKLFV